MRVSLDDLGGSNQICERCHSSKLPRSRSARWSSSGRFVLNFAKLKCNAPHRAEEAESTEGATGNTGQTRYEHVVTSYHFEQRHLQRENRMAAMPTSTIAWLSS